jgi:hypothetical protein
MIIYKNPKIRKIKKSKSRKPLLGPPLDRGGESSKSGHKL